MAIFNPGDQKIFRAQHDPKHPGFVDLIYFFLGVGLLTLGVLTAWFFELYTGLLLSLVGFGISFFIAKNYFEEFQMGKRMRERAEKDEDN